MPLTSIKHPVDGSFIYNGNDNVQGGGEPDAENDVVRCGRRETPRQSAGNHRHKALQRGRLPLDLGVHRAKDLRVPSHAAREREIEIERVVSSW